MAGIEMDQIEIIPHCCDRSTLSCRRCGWWIEWEGVTLAELVQLADHDCTSS